MLPNDGTESPLESLLESQAALAKNMVALMQSQTILVQNQAQFVKEAADIRNAIAEIHADLGEIQRGLRGEMTGQFASLERRLGEGWVGLERRVGSIERRWADVERRWADVAGGVEQSLRQGGDRLQKSLNLLERRSGEQIERAQGRIRTWIGIAVGVLLVGGGVAIGFAVWALGRLG